MSASLTARPRSAERDSSCAPRSTRQTRSFWTWGPNRSDSRWVSVNITPVKTPMPMNRARKIRLRSARIESPLRGGVPVEGATTGGGPEVGIGDPRRRTAQAADEARRERWAPGAARPGGSPAGDLVASVGVGHPVDLHRLDIGGERVDGEVADRARELGDDLGDVARRGERAGRAALTADLAVDPEVANLGLGLAEDRGVEPGALGRARREVERHERLAAGGHRVPLEGVLEIGLREVRDRGALDDDHRELLALGAGVVAEREHGDEEDQGDDVLGHGNPQNTQATWIMAPLKLPSASAASGNQASA